MGFDTAVGRLPAVPLYGVGGALSVRGRVDVAEPPEAIGVVRGVFETAGRNSSSAFRLRLLFTRGNGGVEDGRDESPLMEASKSPIGMAADCVTKSRQATVMGCAQSKPATMMSSFESSG